MFTIRQAAKYLCISATTLRRWDREKRLCAQRTMGNHRRYPKHLLDAYLGIDNLVSSSQSFPNHRIPWAYARVSTQKQDKDGNLDRQADRLVHYIRKHYGFHQHYEMIKEYGSGLNAERKGLQRLIRAVLDHKVSEVIIEFSDRLTRFGYPFLETLFGVFHVPIITVQTKSAVNIEEHLVEDLLMLMASFSGKFYKVRSNLAKGLTKREMAIETVIAQFIDREVDHTVRSVVITFRKQTTKNVV